MIIAILYSGHIEPAHTCLICFRSLVPKVTTSFMCEKQPERQKLLTFRYTYPGKVHLRGTPIFKDMTELWQGHGVDYMTGNVKAVPEARFFSASTSLVC